MRAMAVTTTPPLWKSHDNSLRWRALAERRRAHFVDLYRSGRWKRYYTEEAFLAHMREVVRGAEAWNQLVDPSGAKAEAGTRARIRT
jgi:uncharacterized repeat protein (TIGR03809 family)